MRSALQPGRNSAGRSLRGAAEAPARSGSECASGPERTPLLSARPAAQASAMWPSVSAPASPNCAASGAGADAEGIQDQDDGAPAHGPSLPQSAREWASGTDDGSPSGQADRRTDGICGPGPGSARPLHGRVQIGRCGPTSSPKPAEIAAVRPRWSILSSAPRSRPPPSSIDAPRRPPAYRWQRCARTSWAAHGLTTGGRRQIGGPAVPAGRADRRVPPPCARRFPPRARMSSAASILASPPAKFGTDPPSEQHLRDQSARHLRRAAPRGACR